MKQKQQKRKHAERMMKRLPMDNVTNRLSMHKPLPGNAYSQLKALPTQAAKTSHKKPGLNSIYSYIYLFLKNYSTF